MEWITEGLNQVAQWALMMLPNSPFLFLTDTSIVSPIADILGFINYFVPFGWMANILGVWAGCILVYYLYQTALRWAKVIE